MRLPRLWRGLRARWKRLAAAGASAPAGWDTFTARPEAHALARTLVRLLTENIVPFWYPGVIDSHDGGYRLNHDVAGRWKGPAAKRIVTQARTVWFFARLARSPYGTLEHLRAAEHGYHFLRDHMWDRRFGGFYWEVDSPGRVATNPRKDMMGQSFGLYALAEYALASADAAAGRLARELFDLWETHAHDDQHGGYRREFRHDWSPLPDPYLKEMNTHMHLLEALTAYHRATSDSRARQRVIELILVQSSAVVRKTRGVCTERHQRDWTPLKAREDARVSYGHDLENIWLLAEAMDAAGLPSSLLVDLYRCIFDNAWRYGFDREHGGYFESGPFDAPADQCTKVWWVQAEALVGALTLFHLTNEARHFESFCRTLDWIVARQADWQHGDWHAEISRNGEPQGDKAGTWKSPYHNGRAVLRCLALLGSGAASA